MIYTVTLNPSVDVFLEVNNLNIGNRNHVSDEFTLPGGKALNVSRVLSQLKIPTVATGLLVDTKVILLNNGLIKKISWQIL